MKYKTLSLFIILVIIGLPAIICFALLDAETVAIWKYLTIFLIPFLYTIIYTLTAGLLSIPFQKSIVKGVFKRDLAIPVYRARRLYGICWTMIYYNKFLFNIILSQDYLRILTFRLFGYKGAKNFTIYADSWIRDLPLLIFEEGVYIANRATLGTNVCTNDGHIIVDRIRIKKNSIVGHLATIGFGVTIGENTEVGVRCLIGVYCKLGNNVLIGGLAGVGHFTTIGNNTEVGICCIIGKYCTIGENISIPDYVRIPDNSVINTPEDLTLILNKLVNAA